MPAPSEKKRYHSQLDSMIDGSTDVRPSVRMRTHSSSPTVAHDIGYLLDCSHLTSHSDALGHFDKLADILIRDYSLVLTSEGVENSFEILELEIYLQKAGCHEDPFTHKSNEQKISGQWYFHRAPRRLTNHFPQTSTSARGYKGGTRKGLDINLGGPVVSPYFTPSPPDHQLDLLRGGILLRTIRHLTDASVISGPSLIVDEILRLSKASSISELVEDKWGGNISALRPSVDEIRPVSLYLRRRTSNQSQGPVIYQSPRVGLALSTTATSLSPDPRAVYISKPYRYYIHPHLLTSNGRPQSFLGVYRKCLELVGGDKNSDSVILRSHVAQLTGLKENTVSKYIEFYQLGLRSGLHKLTGKSGKGPLSPADYLQLMGALMHARGVTLSHEASEVNTVPI